MHTTNAAFSLGQQFSGKIISFTPRGILLEIQPNTLGMIRNAAQEATMEIGGTLAVCISEIGASGEIYLERVFPQAVIPAAEDAVAAAPATAQPWMAWQEMPTGHKQASTAILALKQHTDEFRSELAQARAELEEARAQSLQTYDTACASARELCEQACVQYIQDCDSNVAATQIRRKRTENIVRACELFMGNIPENAGGVRTVANDAMASVRGALREAENAIAQKIQAYCDLRDCYIADTERERDAEIAQARSVQQDAARQFEQRFATKHQEICAQHRAEIAVGFPQATIQAYAQAVNVARLDAANYACPSEVPDYVLLGNIGYSIPYQNEEDGPVVQAVEAQTAAFGSREANAYTVQIPYAQRLEEGISLMIRYTPETRAAALDWMQPLLLKLFMAFPAGKLEATMIDPLELGASFPDIPKLAKGPNAARVIDTRIWSKEKDIENVIATLRQKLENVTQAYGTDRESRLKKEAVRALAITDFPIGFSDVALNDLRAIVRNSAALGVCVLICANEQELRKLKLKNETLVAEIAQSVVETQCSGARLEWMGAQNKGVFLQLDDMHDAMLHKDAILEQIGEAIDHKRGKMVRFDSMFKADIYDSSNWFGGNREEIAIPLGIKGADSVVKMVLGRGGGSTEHHALLAGPTGAGKSTLLHTLIMSTLLSYTPEEVQMYLLDFKEGVEFSAYTQYRLPSLRVVAINSEREFGLNVLKELCTELESRSKTFTRKGVSDIHGYAQLPDAPRLPKLLLVFDEVQELFRKQEDSDSISTECLSCLNKLVMQGRAMGIHVILACQDFRNCAGLEAYFSQMAIRIAVKGSEEGAASILSSDNTGIRTLQNEDAGAAIYNGGGGVESANNFFQVSYLEKADRLQLLACMDAYYRSPAVAAQYQTLQSRILLTNAQDDISNCFNQLIVAGAANGQPLAKAKDGYGLLLGQGYGKKTRFLPELRTKDRENLLVVSKDEKLALALFELAAMSVLYEDLHAAKAKPKTTVTIVDLFAEELTDDECDFDHLKDCFPQQVTLAKIGDIEGVISDLYETVMARLEGNEPADRRIFLLFFGINRAKKLCVSKLYEEDRDALSTIEMLQRILVYGPKLGVNSIVWGEGLSGIEAMLGDRYDGMFDKRIAYALEDRAMDMLVAESDAKHMRGKSAVYMDIDNDVKNTHFRPYDVPAREWLERYAKAYAEAIDEEGGTQE